MNNRARIGTILQISLITLGSTFSGLSLSAAAAGSQVQKTYSVEEVKQYFKTAEILDESKTHLYDKLIELFGHKQHYSDEELTTVLEPTDKYPFDDFGAKTETRVGPPPPGALSADQARQYFEVERKHNQKAKGSMAALQKNFGKHDWYLARELRLVDQFGDQPKDYVDSRERNWTPEVEAAHQAAAAKLRPQRLLVRHDWSDVLYAEDPSQPSNQPKKLDDLIGATFSFAHDANAGTDTWGAIGALIWPWLYHSADNRADLIPETFAIAPSFSINRVTTSDPNVKEVDQVFYRLGVYGEWSGVSPLDYLQARGAFVYLTDMNHEARLPGYEFDFEPRSFFLAKNRLSLGARNILWPKEPQKKDDSDQSLIDYQLRAWLHLEGGDLQQSGKNWTATPGDFFRLGPTIQLQINFPEFLKGFSVAAEYSYLAPVTGPEEHKSFLKVGAALALHQDKATGQKVSLTLQYINGGLDFTKDDVETLTIGLGVLF